VPDASAYELAVNLPYAVAVVFVLAESGWLMVRGDRGAPSRLATAATMAVGAALVAVAYTALLRQLWALLHVDATARLWDGHPIAHAVAAFVAWDLAGWLYHRIGHGTRVGWAAHQVHHTGETYDATLGLRQTWAPFHGLLLQPLLALAGFDLTTVVVCAALSNCWQVLVHTSAPIRLPRAVEAVVMTPAAHRHHHGTDGGPVNLGPVLTVWDRLAGTWRPPTEPPPTTYGRPSSSNPFAVEVAGWRALLTA
jgi:sterol desaturase/sphingolipid hydroxylase (fatty acid hydroxylase superfamily)